MYCTSQRHDKSTTLTNQSIILLYELYCVSLRSPALGIGPALCGAVLFARIVWCFGGWNWKGIHVVISQSFGITLYVPLVLFIDLCMHTSKTIWHMCPHQYVKMHRFAYPNRCHSILNQRSPNRPVCACMVLMWIMLIHVSHVHRWIYLYMYITLCIYTYIYIHI